MANVLYKSIFGLIFAVLFLSLIVNAAGPAAVNLGTAGNFAILSKAGISTTGTTSITGDIGVSPIAATAITGFGLILDSSNQFATSSLLNGKAYASNYATPTPAKMTTAISDMQTAYTDAAGRTNPTATELGAGNIGGKTIAPGLYKWGTGVTIPTSVTLSGGPNDVWIFQIGQTLDVGNGVNIILSGGAQPQNVFWQVAGQATLGTTSDFKGIILSKTAIVLNTGAKLNGRALAQTAVTLNANALTAPSGTTTPPPIVTCTSFTYSNWNTCANGQQTRTVVSSTPNGCTGGNPVLSQACSSNAVTCTSFTYSNWNTCANGQQTRTVVSSTPNGCTGGNPVLSQSCTPTTAPPTVSTPTPVEPTPAPVPAPTQPTSSQPVINPSANTTATASDNPGIVLGLNTPNYVAPTQTQMARNFALGLPAGASNSTEASGASASTNQTTQPTPAPAAAPLIKSVPTPVEPTPAPIRAPAQTGQTTAPTSKPNAEPAPSSAPATGGSIADIAGSIANGIGSAIQSVVSWFGSLLGGK